MPTIAPNDSDVFSGKILVTQVPYVQTHLIQRFSDTQQASKGLQEQFLAKHLLPYWTSALLQSHTTMV